jgi:hypothetical protein
VVVAMELAWLIEEGYTYPSNLTWKPVTASWKVWRSLNELKVNPEQLRESIGNIGLSSACIDCDSHVLLSFTKKCEFGRTIDWKANKKFTRT